MATPAEIYEQPNSRWVADFIGDVNLIEGRVVAAGPGEIAVERVAGERLTLASSGEAVPVTVLDRDPARKVKIAPATQPAEANGFTGVVLDIGHLGGARFTR